MLTKDKILYELRLRSNGRWDVRACCVDDKIFIESYVMFYKLSQKLKNKKNLTGSERYMLCIKVRKSWDDFCNYCSFIPLYK